MKSKAKTIQTTLPESAPDNWYLVGCTLDSDAGGAGKDWRMVVEARFPHDGTSILFRCRACSQLHHWIVDDRLRNWKDRS